MDFASESSDINVSDFKTLLLVSDSYCIIAVVLFIYDSFTNKICLNGTDINTCICNSFLISQYNVYFSHSPIAKRQLLANQHYSFRGTASFRNAHLLRVN